MRSSSHVIIAVLVLSIGSGVLAQESAAPEYDAPVVPQAPPAATATGAQITGGESVTAETRKTRVISSTQVSSFTRLLKMGRLDDAQRVIERLEQTAPGDPVLVLMAEQLELVREKQNSRANLISKVYRVADLVVPIERTVDLAMIGKPSTSTFRYAARTKIESGPVRAHNSTANANFTPLINLIKNRVATDTWDSKEGPGLIRPYTNNLSLVIYQSAEVHARIEELLATLRSERDRQATMQFHIVQTGKFGDVLPMDPTVNKVLSPEQMQDAVRKWQGDSETNLVRMPTLTAFSQQIARVTGGRVGNVDSTGLSFLMSPTVSDDRRSVSMRFALNRLTAEAVFASTRHAQIPDGHTWVIDVDQLKVTTQRGAALALPATTDADTPKTLLLITASVVTNSGNSDSEIAPLVDSTTKPQTGPTLRGPVMPYEPRIAREPETVPEF